MHYTHYPLPFFPTQARLVNLNPALTMRLLELYITVGMLTDFQRLLSTVEVFRPTTLQAVPASQVGNREVSCM
jgi:hypothetical protein